MIKREVVIGDCRLLLGDCLEVLHHHFPACFRVGAVITDPPYGVGFTGKLAVQRGGGQTKGDSGYASFEDTPDNIDSIIVPAIVRAIEIARRGAVTPGTRNMFKYPTPADVGCFYSAAGTGVGRWGFTCSQPILFYGKDPFLEAGRGSRANSLGQTYPNDANAVGHPCAKPLPQMLWLVGRASAEGETVLDPFMGSGTTGVACVKLGRKFIGIEIDEGYFDIACERIRKAYAQPDMFIETARVPEPKQEALSL
jgi:DNA modification methylase